VQTEGKAKIRAATYADSIPDPLLRQAITLDGFEEGATRKCYPSSSRPMASRSNPSPNTRGRVTRNGLDDPRVQRMHRQLLRFGLFAVARQSAFFPPELVEHLRAGDPGGGAPYHLLRELGRVHYRNLPWWQKPWWWARFAAVWVRLVRERIGFARGVGAGKDEKPQDNQFHADRRQGR